MSQPPDAATPAPDAGLLTVLVVDADERRRHESLDRLRPCADRLLDAESGELALYLLTASAVDLVVTDLDLPGMSGVDLLQELRRRGGPPVVALLSQRATAARVAWLDAGGAACVSPAEDPVALHARCRAVLRRS